ncbi:MAG: GDSL-type esterase/lipase family protein [Bacteroidota bacterium]
MNKIIFLGDSITKLGDWKTLLPDFDIDNYGVSGNKTYQVTERVERLFNKKSNQLFLLIGINDLGDNRTVYNIEKDYRRLVNLILENDVASDINLVSVLPIKEGELSKPGLKPEKILQLNDTLKVIVKDNNLKFVDIYSSFADKNGELKEGYTNDGLHLNEEGYKIYSSSIKKYLKR